jgi:hypothetical protein
MIKQQIKMKREKIFLVLATITITVLTSCASPQCTVNMRITDDITVKSVIETNSSQFLSEIRNAFAGERRPDFTNLAVSPEASGTVLDIWDNISVIDCNVSTLDKKCTKRYNGGYQVKDIPVIMPDIAPDTLQKIVINYTGEGIIDAIYLSMDSISAILPEESDDREKCRREKIIDFIEQYRMAHFVKDLDFIRKVFMPDKLVHQEEIDYRLQSKAHYLRKLKFIFAANRYTVPEFKEIEIRPHPKNNELYGTVFRQYWNTSTYKDDGYIFFMIDFEKEDDPQIHIFTYHHGKDSKDEIFNLYMFNIKE